MKKEVPFHVGGEKSRKTRNPLKGPIAANEGVKERESKPGSLRLLGEKGKNKGCTQLIRKVPAQR